MGELDSAIANLFLRLCSLCICLKADDIYLDARVASLGGNAASNALQNYGLGFDQLNVLQEHNLIISDYNSFFDYRVCIAGAITGVNNQIVFPFQHQNRNYGLIPINERPKEQAFQLHGVALSKSGKELMKIVDIQPFENYTAALTAYFVRQGLQMLEIDSSVGI